MNARLVGMCTVLASILSVAAMACAVTPSGSAFTYQGQVKQNSSPITGSVDLQFSLFDAPAGGSPINGLTLSQNLSVTDGLFTTELDFGAGALIGDERWLEIAVRFPAGSGNYTSLVPRQRLNPAPYALFALNAMVFGTQGGTVNFTNAANAFAGSGSGLTNLNASNISSGTLGSAQLSGAYSNILNFDNASNVFTGSFSGGGAGLTGVNANLLDGLDSTAFLQTVPLPFSGSAASPNAAFKATNIGTGYGLSGESAGSDGVHGYSTANAGNGVYGEANVGIGAYGVYGVSSGGRGVFGSSETGYGVFGNSLSSAGVFGHSDSGYGVSGSSDDSDGVHGSSSADGGNGVHGTSTTGIGVRGDSTAGDGVQGFSTALGGNGVYGEALNGIGAYGVFGLTSLGRGVVGRAISPTGATFGVVGESLSANGTGVFGEALDSGDGTTYGVRGRCNTAFGAAVFGEATHLNGDADGGRFETASAWGNGVLGVATNPVSGIGGNRGVTGISSGDNGIGVSGLALSNGAGVTFGVLAECNSESGRGIYGGAYASTGITYGGEFHNNSTSGYAVYGRAAAPSGANYGGYFQSNSTSGVGMYGNASANTGFNFGGLFNSNSPDGRAIRAVNSANTGLAVAGRFSTPSTSGIGLWSSATASTGATFGVYGESASASGYGVWAQGRLGASGTKSFRIDHPDDPENKYLLHYSAESPEVINFYRGTVVLNGAGEAVVDLPAYFAKINTNPSYMLTAVGAPMPNLHIADEIAETSLSIGSRAEPGQIAPPCWFRIAGGAPGAKVSWRVEAVRNDRWIQQRGAPVETEKQDLERGTYQHPELYGQPPEKGMNYDAPSREPREPAEGPNVAQR